MNIDSLDFPEIRKNFIEYLKNDPNETFGDVDYAASGINALLNILTYNTHYNGMYSKMLLNEAFVDSAVLKTSLMSKAKLTQYLPKGKKSATAEIQVEVVAYTPNSIGFQPEPLNKLIIIPKGTCFTSTNSNADNRIFTLLDDIIVRNRVVSPDEVTPKDPTLKKITYTSAPFVIHEGDLIQWDFLVNNSLIAQRYIIKDPNIDVDTLKVYVGKNDVFNVYKRATDSFDVKSGDFVYYIATNEQGFYEIYFGESAYGNMPAHGDVIKTEFLSTNGESGNGARVFAMSKTDNNHDVNFIGFYTRFNVTTKSGSSMGANEESLESLRFNIPNHFKMQNRLINKTDYYNIILQHFRNIDSINVWGGEENYYKDYGKIYISIKPKGANAITEQVKDMLRSDIFKPYGVIGSEVVFRDPEFLDVDLEVSADIDKKNSLYSIGEVSNLIRQNILNYNAAYLNKFENYYSDYRLIDYVVKNVPHLKSVYTKKMVHKTYLFYLVNQIKHIIYIGNSVRPGTVKSTEFFWKGSKWTIQDRDGALVYVNSQSKEVETAKGEVNYQTGVLIFEFPEFAYSVENSTKDTAVLIFSAEPANPDVYSYQNNIVSIRNIDINLS